MNKITNIKQLKKEATNGLDCFISLAGGLIRSSKTIYFNGKHFTIYNDIDGTEQKLTEKQLATNTNIIEAIKNKALIKI